MTNLFKPGTATEPPESTLGRSRVDSTPSGGGGGPLSPPGGPHPHDDHRYTVQKTDAQWREQLDPMQFKVARQAATERPFTGKFWDHWDNGVYRCVGCNRELFRSDTKFDAGCGWPSYYEEIAPGRVERIVDSTLGMVRVEVRCAACGTHLGHVFDDGPQPTGERYCINSAAIEFQAKP